MYGIMYPDGDIDLCYYLEELREELLWVRAKEAEGYSSFAGAEPVVRVGTNPDDYQWETFEDARVEIPAVWWDWFPDE